MAGADSAAEEIGHGLRHGDSPYLKRRRSIVGLAFFSCGVLGAVALYQIGIIKKLPQPPGHQFSSEKVHGSGQAYAMLSIPDAFLGLTSYATTAAFASMGKENRAESHPWMTLAAGAKLIADSAMAGKLTMDEFTKIHAFSVWSAATAVATWIALPLAFPEMRRALNQIGKRT